MTKNANPKQGCDIECTSQGLRLMSAKLFFTGMAYFGSQFLFISIEEPDEFHDVFCFE